MNKNDSQLHNFKSKILLYSYLTRFKLKKQNAKCFKKLKREKILRLKLKIVAVVVVAAVSVCLNLT